MSTADRADSIRTAALTLLADEKDPDYRAILSVLADACEEVRERETARETRRPAA